jgi:hypothetical protein
LTVGLYSALTHEQRRLRDAVCRRHETLEGRLRLLKTLGRELNAESADVERVRGWLFDFHGRETR